MDSTLTHSQNFLDLSETLPGFPSWVEDLRAKARHSFSLIPIPSPKQEDWRFTPLDKVLKNSFRLSPAESCTAPYRAKTPLVQPSDINIIFCDGQLVEIERLPEVAFDALQIISWGQGAQTYQKDMSSALMKFDGMQETFFSSLAKAFFYSGVFLQVNEHTHIKPLIHIVHYSTGRIPNRLLVPRVLIHLKQHSSAQIMQTCVSTEPSAVYLNAPLTEIVLEHESSLDVIHAQNEPAGAFHFSSINAVLHHDSHFQSFCLSTGGLLTRNNLCVQLREPRAESLLNGLYCVNKDQLVDNHTIIQHPVEQCRSRQEYKGILMDSSNAVFNGKIRVSPQAQGTESYQLNKNLLLGKDAKVHTKPELEIEADDVKCSHGATVGQLSDDHIFYLRSRGVSKRSAVRMLAEGFALDLILAQRHPDARTHLMKILQPKLEDMS